MEETKKLLEKQLQILSEQSEQAKDSEEAARLSQIMCDVSDALSRSEAAYRDAFEAGIAKTYHNRWAESRIRSRREADNELELEDVRKKYRQLLIIQLIQAAAIILHTIFMH